jgi:quinol monooxygenase YgiN
MWGAKDGRANAMTGELARLTVVFKVAARRSKEVVAALRFLMVTTRLEPGCRNCGVWIDSDSAVRYLEEWATELDMRERVRSERFTSLLSVIESVEEPPLVQFDFVATTRGLDYVAEVRGRVASDPSGS